MIKYILHCGKLVMILAHFKIIQLKVSKALPSYPMFITWLRNVSASTCVSDLIFNLRYKDEKPRIDKSLVNTGDLISTIRPSSGINP